MIKIALTLGLLLLSNCAMLQKSGMESKPEVTEMKMQKEFDTVPAPAQKKITVAVYSFQDKTGQRRNTPINQFMVNLESRIYAQISQNLATAMFADGAATTGSMTFQGNTIFWNKNGTTSITLMVTDTLGNNTTIEVPLGQFTFN